MQIARKTSAGAVQASRNGRTLTVSIVGRFDFGLHQEFRRTVSDLAGLTEVVINLRETVYLDSSALGMLLLLHDACSAAHITTSIVDCTPPVRQVLDVASFHQLFSIS